MRIALLSAGPSLVQTFNDSLSFDVRIGVNTAVEHFACDWWCVGDRHLLIGENMAPAKPIGNPRIYTTTETIDRVGLTTALSWSEAGPQYSPPMEDTAKGRTSGWDTWTATAAVVLARHLNATSLDVYGVDMAGHSDVSGRVGGRSDHRWQRERPVWEACIQWIRAQGVRVVIHQPNGTPEVVAA